MNTSAVPRQTGVSTRTGIALGLLGALSLFVVIGLVSYLNTRTLSQEAESVTHTHEVLSALDEPAFAYVERIFYRADLNQLGI